DDRERAGDDAGRQQAELVGGVADHQRVPGIVPALEAHHRVGTACQPVDDLALAFIAPLGADHGDVGQAGFLLRGRCTNRAALGVSEAQGKAGMGLNGDYSDGCASNSGIISLFIELTRSAVRGPGAGGSWHRPWSSTERSKQAITRWVTPRVSSCLSAS